MMQAHKSELSPASSWRSNGAPASERRFRSALVTALLAIGLLILILVPRLSDLDALVTPDEPLWVVRSANFYQALSSGHLEHTYQFVHPGVPVMWLGTLAYRITRPDLPDEAISQIATRGDEPRELLTAHGDRMIDVLVDLRTAVTIFSALVLLGLFFCLIPLVGRWSSAAAVAFISLDPMHIGFTRLLHLDGLSTNLLLVSVVAFCVYQQRRSRWFLVVSGFAAGVAVLTRSANGVLAPLVALLAAADIALAWWHDRAVLRPMLRRYLIALVIWGGVAFVTAIALWPAMWVAPIDTFSAMWSGGLDLASDPHARQIMFRGEVTLEDPGWPYYPAVLAYRISPLTLVGLGLALVAALLPRPAGIRLNRMLCLNLLLFAGAYVVILSLAAKKLDRYVLPSVVALDLVAVLGWIAMAQWLAGKLLTHDFRVEQGVTVALVGVMLLGQSTLAADTRPYYINEATPLLGGPAGARDSLSFGWGEGGKPVAEALLQIPDIAERTVMAGPWQTTIDYYLPFTVEKPLYALTSEAAAQWLATDYIVVTQPEVQRQLYPPTLLAWFDQQEPLMTVVDAGHVYARIFDVRGDRLPEPFFMGPESGTLDLANGVQLIAADLPSVVRQGNNARIHLAFQGTGAAAELRIDLDVVTAEGAVVGSVSDTHVIDDGRRSPTTASFSVPLPADLAPGEYAVRVTFRDAATGDLLPATRTATGESVTYPVPLGETTVAVLPESGA